MRTSVSSERPVPSSSDSASVAMSGRPEAEPRAVGPRHDAAPAVGDHERQAAPVDRGAQAHRALAVGVGVHDDVGAGLGDGELDVREGLVVDLEDLAEPAHGVAHHGDVLRARGQRDLEIGKLRLHALRVGRLGHAEPGRRTCAHLLALSLIIAPLPLRTPILPRPPRREYAQTDRDTPPSGPDVTTSGRPKASRR